ncbi:hypothetical protein ACTQYA_06180 [Bifidobacterium catenulatum]
MPTGDAGDGKRRQGTAHVSPDDNRTIIRTDTPINSLVIPKTQK